MSKFYHKPEAPITNQQEETCLLLQLEPRCPISNPRAITDPFSNTLELLSDINPSIYNDGQTY